MKTINKNLKKLITLVKEANEIKGRTKFQKIVYILKTKGVAFEEKFKYHYYGPFSSELQLEIDELVDRKWLIEEGENPFIYKVSNNISSFLEEDNTISNYKDLIEFLNEQDYRKLELVSTIFFLKNNLIDNEEIIRKKVASLKPHLINLIDESYSLAKEIEKK